MSETERGRLQLLWARAWVGWTMHASLWFPSLQVQGGYCLDLFTKKIQTRGEQKLLGVGCEPGPLSQPSPFGTQDTSTPAAPRASRPDQLLAKAYQIQAPLYGKGHSCP